MDPSSKAQLGYNGYSSNFANYMRNDANGTGNLQSAYAGYPSAAHPFFQSAVAAVAAAAAGYSQQFQTGVPSAGIPLNLSNMIGAPRNSFCPNSAASSQSVLDAASRYQAYQNYSQYYQNNNGINNYRYPEYSQQQQIPQQAYQRHTSAFQPTGYSSSVMASNPQQQQTTQSQQNPIQPKPASVRRTKKRSASFLEKEPGRADGESDEVKKKEEFDKLVKARTDKLLSDGPGYSPLTVNECTLAAASAGSSGSSSLGDSVAIQNAKMMKTILDMKTRTLLQSPGVMAFLSSRQRLIESYKRQTELFSTQHQLQHHHQQQRASLQ